MLPKLKRKPEAFIQVGTIYSYMITSLIKKTILLATIVLVFISCSKDEDNSETNPTNGMTTAVFNMEVTYGTLTDQEGNIYKTVTIGTQTWMAENLRTMQYNDGTAIPCVTDNTVWSGLSTGAYCNYNNTTNIDTIATYGRLYNWHAVNSGKLAPKGWHVATDAEWTTLITFLGGESIAHGKLKELATTHWTNPNFGATNESGFTALPGGLRDDNGFFGNLGLYGYWWSDTESEANTSWFRALSYGESNESLFSYSKQFAFSVRCVKD